MLRWAKQLLEEVGQPSLGTPRSFSKAAICSQVGSDRWVTSASIAVSVLWRCSNSLQEQTTCTLGRPSTSRTRLRTALRRPERRSTSAAKASSWAASSTTTVSGSRKPTNVLPNRVRELKRRREGRYVPHLISRGVSLDGEASPPLAAAQGRSGRAVRIFPLPGDPRRMVVECEGPAIRSRIVRSSGRRIHSPRPYLSATSAKASKLPRSDRGWPSFRSHPT